MHIAYLVWLSNRVFGLKGETATNLRYLTSEYSTVHAWMLLIFYGQT